MIAATSRAAAPSAARPRRALALTLLVATVVLAACPGSERRAAAPRGADSASLASASSAAAAPRPSTPPFSEISPESAAADRAARAALPSSLASALALDAYLSDRYIARTPGAECLVQSPAGAVEERRRVHLRLPDGSALVVFARVDTAERAVRRVEIMRNPVGSEQIAFTLDGEGDVTNVIRWPDRGRGKAVSALHPSGGPLPRALRSVARRLWTLKCPANGPAAG